MVVLRCGINWLYITVLIVFLWLCSTGAATARIYRYVDLSGATHYTDNALKVPVDQRPPLEETSLKVEEQTVASNQPVSSVDKAAQEALAKKDALEKQKTRMDTRFEQLNRNKQKLDAEFDAINRERQQLEKERVVKHSRRTYRIYNQKIKNLDARIKAYNARRQAFDRQAEAYNAKMRLFDEHRKRLNDEIEAFNQAKATAVSP